MRPTSELLYEQARSTEPAGKPIAGGAHRPEGGQDLIPAVTWVRLGRVRKLIFIAFLALGALVGLLTSARDDWGTRIIMMGVGVLFAAPVGAAFTIIGSRRSAVAGDDHWHRRDGLTGDGTSADDLAANYGRDKGYPPFMKPPEGLPDKHQFDPNRLG